MLLGLSWGYDAAGTCFRMIVCFYAASSFAEMICCDANSWSMMWYHIIWYAVLTRYWRAWQYDHMMYSLNDAMMRCSLGSVTTGSEFWFGKRIWISDSGSGFKIGVWILESGRDLDFGFAMQCSRCWNRDSVYRIWIRDLGYRFGDRGIWVVSLNKESGNDKTWRSKKPIRWNDLAPCVFVKISRPCMCKAGCPCMPYLGDLWKPWNIVQFWKGVRKVIASRVWKKKASLKKALARLLQFN